MTGAIDRRLKIRGGVFVRELRAGLALASRLLALFASFGLGRDSGAVRRTQYGILHDQYSRARSSCRQRVARATFVAIICGPVFGGRAEAQGRSAGLSVAPAAPG